MARPPRLSPADVTAALAALPHWSGDSTGIERTLTRVDLHRAADVLAELAVIADDLDHHPDVDVRWQTLRVFLTTHSAGGVTALDVEYARRVDELLDLPAVEDRDPTLQQALAGIEEQLARGRAHRAGHPDSGA